MRKNSAGHGSKTLPKEFRICVDKLVYGGDGLGRLEGKVIFVPFSAPGEELLVRAVESRKGFARAEVREILRPSPSRRVPACRYFGVCGGCHWQHIEYAVQLEAKRSILKEIFHHRFPETRDLEINMRSCPAEYGYRSRARIQVRSSTAGPILGFYRMRSHTVEQIEECPLLRPSLNSVLATLRERFRKNPPPDTVREIEIAASDDTRRWACSSPGHEVEFRIASDHPADQHDTLLVRKVGGIAYFVSPSLFFQANDFVVPDLVSCVMRLVEQADPGSAIDLYGGVGLFSLPLAHHAREVVVVESNPAAADLCRANAAAAGLSNVRVLQTDASEWLISVTSSLTPEFDLVLLDPPRTGAGREVMGQLSSIGAKTIIYVSCDPQTLARDLVALCEHGYRIDFVEGLDLFPQTYHFETVVRLRRA